MFQDPFPLPGDTMVIADDDAHSNEFVDVNCNLHILFISQSYLLI